MRIATGEASRQSSVASKATCYSYKRDRDRDGIACEK
ncbi:excalibur calcium-binding domain-containing protein [Pseudoclavibacter sp. CFCC 11306]